MVNRYISMVAKINIWHTLLLLFRCIKTQILVRGEQQSHDDITWGRSEILVSKILLRMKFSFFSLFQSIFTRYKSLKITHQLLQLKPTQRNFGSSCIAIYEVHDSAQLRAIWVEQNANSGISEWHFTQSNWDDYFSQIIFFLPSVFIF